MRHLFIFLILFCNYSFGQEIPNIRSQEIDEADYRFEKSIEDYHKSENWKLWSFPFKKSENGMQIPSSDSIGISVYEINDSDLKTALFFTDTVAGNLPKFEFTIEFSEFGFFGSAYQFYGLFTLFNGNCSSLDYWTEYSRIKNLNLYLNQILICSIELSDTWHIQFIDISHLFRNIYLNKNLDAPYEIMEGDKITFEITGVYQGTKYKQVALSELLYQGASN